MTKIWKQLQENMHNVGCHVIRGRKDVYMIPEENSQDKNFRHYWRTGTSKMCVLVQRIRNLTLYVKECTKQQTVGNILRILLHSEPPQNITTAKEIVDEALSIATHAMRAGVHTTLGSSPGSSVFNRDMFLYIPLIANWHAITPKREHLIHENLLHENQKRRRHDYASQQRVVKKCWKPRKLDERTNGPYRVLQLQTHVNGTVTIELRPRVSERLNIRRIIPYKE